MSTPASTTFASIGTSPTTWRSAVSERPLRTLRETEDGDGAPADVEREVPSDATSEEEVVLCAECGHEITKADERIVVDGKHEHVFTNPHGIVFHVACYASAPGAVGVGAESEEWTWFAGYAWRAVACRGCLSHLGWSYRGGDSEFHGLIVPKIVVSEV